MDVFLEEIILHDLKNPLSGIVAAADLFTNGNLGELTEEQKSFIQMIKISAKLITKMLIDLQDISRLENQRFTTKKEYFSIEKLVNNFSWLQNHAKNDAKAINIQAEKERSICTDQELLTRVIENLVLTALRQTCRNGKVLLSITPADKNLLFEVHDHGEGVPEDKANQLFNKSFKLENPDLKTKAGEGLGLYFCSLAITALGGELKIKSGAGKGTVFFFSLPAS